MALRFSSPTCALPTLRPKQLPSTWIPASQTVGSKTVKLPATRVPSDSALEQHAIGAAHLALKVLVRSNELLQLPNP